MTVSRYRVEAVLRYDDMAGGLVTYGLVVLDRMTGNASFPNPVPPLSELASAIDALRQAETDAQLGGPPDTAIRNARKSELLALLKLLCAWVEYIANKNPPLAIAMIESSGFYVKGSTHPNAKALIRVVQGRLSGTVDVHVKMPKKDARIWYRMSADGGQTWIDVASLRNSKYTVTGLTPGKTYLFRFDYMLRDDVRREGCEPVAFMVK
jgi:hypothetical protein